jgi:rod shape-determining protein MreD
MALMDQTPGIRPRLTLGRRLDIAARLAFPTCMTILLMLLTEIPLGMPNQAALLPAVALIAVWFWSLFRPGSLPPPAVFLLGLLLDLRGYLPLGAGVLTLLIVHGVALRWRRFLVEQGFAMVWIAFLPLAIGGAALIWLLTALLTFRLLSPIPALFQAVITAALYPVLAIPLSRAHRSLADPTRA